MAARAVVAVSLALMAHAATTFNINARGMQQTPLQMNIPVAGSLGPITGYVNVPNPLDYQFCVYLRSSIDTYNGPKPFERADSYAPIAADGSFTYAGWLVSKMHHHSSYVYIELYIYSTAC